MASSKPDQDWEKVSDQDGIVVWRLNIPGKDLPGFRGEAIIHGSVDEVMTVVQDNQHHTDWMYRCKESAVRKVATAGENIFLLMS